MATIYASNKYYFLKEELLQKHVRVIKINENKLSSQYYLFSDEAFGRCLQQNVDGEDLYRSVRKYLSITY